MEVLQLGNEVLRQKSEPLTEVTDEIRTLINDMFETMISSNGVGLAAPQIGKLIRLFVIIADDDVRRVFINPQIISTSLETCEYEEGCLSIPKLYENIIRPSKVTVQAINENGKPFVLEAEGLLARVIQHENDHLDGVLYIDRGDPSFKEKAIEHFAKKEQRKKEKEALKLAKARKLQNKLQKKDKAND